MAQVTVTKISNGYLVTSFGDDGAPTGSKAVIKAATGNVPLRDIGSAVTSVLGKITSERKTRAPKTRKARKVAPEAAPAAVA